MAANLALLMELGQSLFLAGFAVFLRVGAAMATLPAFGERSVPMRVRLVLTLAFTAITAPAVADRLPEIDMSSFIGPFVATEIIVGLALGAVLRLFVIVLQIAGSMAAQSVSLAQIFGNAGADPQPAIGHIMVVAGLALAVMSGLHIKIAAFLVLSYELLPPGDFPDPADLLEWGLGRTSQAFALGFTLAAPFAILSLIYNLALGVINRAMPQLMVAFVGAPAITAGGLILLMLSLPVVLQVWLGVMDDFFLDPMGARR